MSRVPLPTEPIEVEVEGFTHGGEGVARIEGKAVFVAGTLPGERVRLRVVDDRRRWARARLLEVLEASDDRVDPPCPYVPECGGCDLQHVAPAGQRRLKTRVVREQLVRLGGLTDPPVDDCRAVGPDVGYRTHARLSAAEDGRLGYHRAASHEVVPVDACLILTHGAQTVRDGVGDATGATEVTVRAHGSSPGEPDPPPLASGSAAAVLTPGSGPLELPGGDFDLSLRQPDGSTIAMRGAGTLTQRIAGVDYAFDVDGFFQVSQSGAEALVATVRAAVAPIDGALVWDLYAGVGLLSIPLARDGGEVVAVEGDSSAAVHARANAAGAGVELEVRAEPVGAMLAREVRMPDPPDVVVLDPPRVGAGAEVISRLAALAPATIVYVACDVAALARDTRTLTERGFRLRRAVPLDLFPMTHHVEVVATFDR